MRKLLLTTTALAALAFAAPAQAQVVENLGINPTSATGTFNDAVFGTTFTNSYTFTLTGPFPQYITFATAENTYTNPLDFITNFTGQLFEGVPSTGTAVGPVVSAIGCPGNPDGCQVLAGSAVLDPGSYYLELTGTGGGTAGYSGSVTTLAVPGPILGGGLPVLLGFAGFAFWRRRRQQATSTL